MFQYGIKEIQLNDVKLSQEDELREGLKDVLIILEKIAPKCSNFQELSEILNVALSNDGQLRMLLTLINPQAKR